MERVGHEGISRYVETWSAEMGDGASIVQLAVKAFFVAEVEAIARKMPCAHSSWLGKGTAFAWRSIVIEQTHDSRANMHSS